MQRIEEFSVHQLKERLDRGENVFLLDVREPFEAEIANIGGVLIPLGELSTRFQELDSTQEIVVYCHHGNRSRYAAEFLQRQGFGNVKNLSGGIDAWSTEIEPTKPRY